ncbi:MAG: protein-export chaperone SecB [Alphaproteobacteria bacterium]|nr:protein-export chaperone SecB [Alphaproteobacteria bacterium]
MSDPTSINSVNNTITYKLIAQYLKDLSYENPHALAIVENSKRNYQGNFTFNIVPQQVNVNHYEVSLKIKSVLEFETKVFCLLEMDYAGLFYIATDDNDIKNAFLMVQAPHLIFPFARHIFSTISKEGLLHLPPPEPIDFLKVYEQQKATNRLKEETSSKEASIH